MFDIHSHLIYKVDDGSKSLEDTLKSIEQASAYGVKHMMATSHYIKGSVTPDPDVMQARLDEIRSEINSRQIPIEVHLGNELYIDEALIEDLDAKQCLTLAGTKYILMELPMRSEVNRLEAFVHELKVAGYQLILAHPERYTFVQKDINSLKPLLDDGVLLQMNLGSLLGQYGKHIQQTAIKMLDGQMIHFVGSDVHRSEKLVDIPKALKILKKHLPEDKYQAVLYKNGDTLLKNETITPLPFKKRKKKWVKPLIIGLASLIIVGSSVLYYGFKKVEAQFEAAMIEQAREMTAAREAAEEAEKLANLQKAEGEKAERDAEREAERLERLEAQKTEDEQLLAAQKLKEEALKAEEEAALKALQEAEDEAEKKAAAEAAAAAQAKLEAEQKSAAEAQAKIEAERKAEEERIIAAAKEEETRLEAERLAAEKAAEEEKARLEAEKEAQFTNYETDKAKALDLALSKLTVDQVNSLIDMAAGGFDPEERQIAKAMFYSNFTAEEQTWILEMYAQYYGG